MRISDWSSDVCSSDLLGEAERRCHDARIGDYDVDRLARRLQNLRCGPYARKGSEIHLEKLEAATTRRSGRAHHRCCLLGFRDVAGRPDHMLPMRHQAARRFPPPPHGHAAGRERAWQYVWIRVAAVTI